MKARSLNMNVSTALKQVSDTQMRSDKLEGWAYTAVFAFESIGSDLLTLHPPVPLALLDPTCVSYCNAPI